MFSFYIISSVFSFPQISSFSSNRSVEIAVAPSDLFIILHKYQEDYNSLWIIQGLNVKDVVPLITLQTTTRGQCSLPKNPLKRMSLVASIYITDYRETPSIILKIHTLHSGLLLNRYSSLKPVYIIRGEFYMWRHLSIYLVSVSHTHSQVSGTFAILTEYACK